MISGFVGDGKDMQPLPSGYRDSYTIRMRVRDYQTGDLRACLAVFDSNVPLFFKPHEREQFVADLPLIERYLVIEAGDAIAGCGGYAVRTGTTTADLCWGMVRRDLHGAGLGRRLLEERLKRIQEQPGITKVALNTSQHTQRFYERYGFVTVQVTRNGYAPGLDRCDMLLKL
jgi:ribosomal protein S18 acetylase RimI-like enzyme